MHSVTYERSLGELSRWWTGSLQTSVCEWPQWWSVKELGSSTHHELLSCSRKMVVYKEKTYPTQNLGLHVSKTAMKKACNVFLTTRNATLSIIDTSFWINQYLPNVEGWTLQVTDTSLSPTATATVGVPVRVCSVVFWNRFLVVFKS